MEGGGTVMVEEYKLICTRKESELDSQGDIW